MSQFTDGNWEASSVKPQRHTGCQIAASAQETQVIAEQHPRPILLAVVRFRSGHPAMADDLSEYGYGDLFRGLGANFHADRRDDPI